jgi:hypothetical protein
MTILYLAMVMVMVGVAMAAWGLPAAHRLRAPWDILAAVSVLAGGVVSFLGVLLLAVPRFFEG